MPFRAVCRPDVYDYDFLSPGAIPDPGVASPPAPGPPRGLQSRTLINRDKSHRDDGSKSLARRLVVYFVSCVALRLNGLDFG